MSDSSPDQSMNTPIPTATLALRAIRVEGRDAFAFLQAQLTADLNEMEESGALMPAAWCDANGRVSLFCHAAWDDQGAWLIAPADRTADTLRRIRMYGIGRDVDAHDAGPVLPTDPGTPDALRFSGDPPRALAPAETLRDDATPPLPDDWLREDLRRRIPWITTATAGLFLPQMIGVDTLGGLSYRKGCYPGQEVIARVHYRGRVTRRPVLMRVQSASRPLSGAALTPERGDPRVLYAAPDPEGGYLMLAVIPVGNEDDPEIDHRPNYRLDDRACVILDNPS